MRECENGGMTMGAQESMGKPKSVAKKATVTGLARKVRVSSSFGQHPDPLGATDFRLVASNFSVFHLAPPKSQRVAH